MATRTIANGGGNWSANGTWVEGVAPTATDDVVATATSGNLVINSSTLCFCLSADFTNYTGTLSGNGIIRLSGNLTFVAGMTITATGNIGIIASGTWTSNGQTWSGAIQPLAPATITLADDFICAGQFTHSSTGGAQIFNGNTLYLRGNYTASSGRTITGTTLIVLNTTTTQTINVSGTFSSSLSIDATGDIIIQGLNYQTGTITYVTANSFSHTGTVTILNSCTFNTAGISWNNIIASSNAVITVNSLLTILGTLTSTAGSVTWTGTSGWNAGTYTITTGNQRFNGPNAYTVTTAFNASGTSANTAEMFRLTGGTPFIFTLQHGATQDVDFLDTNEMNAGLGQTIWTYRGTPTSSTNIKVMPTQPQPRSY